MPKIVGLDLSLQGTGVFSYPENTGFLVSTGKLEGMPRLQTILKTVLKMNTGDTLFIIEDFAYSRGNQAHQIGGLSYLIRYHLWDAHVPFALVGPQQVKKFITGKGNCDKNVVLKEVYKKLKIDLNDDNIADACVLAHIGAAAAGLWKPKNADQKKIVAELIKKFPAVFVN